jgi:hypothetical protein
MCYISQISLVRMSHIRDSLSLGFHELSGMLSKRSEHPPSADGQIDTIQQN